MADDIMIEPQEVLPTDLSRIGRIDLERLVIQSQHRINELAAKDAARATQSPEQQLSEALRANIIALTNAPLDYTVATKIARLATNARRLLMDAKKPGAGEGLQALYGETSSTGFDESGGYVDAAPLASSSPFETGGGLMIRELLTQFSTIFKPAQVEENVSSISELIRGIAEAKELGLKDVEADLRAALKQRTSEVPALDLRHTPRIHDARFDEPPEHTERTSLVPVPSISKANWIDTPGGPGDLGSVDAAGMDIPKRAKHHVAAADAYFNEAEHRMAEDEARLQSFTDVFDNND